MPMSASVSVVRVPRQLPSETSGFVGRRPELAALSMLLRKSRLVTVTGLGGVGKTRLALRAARNTAAGFRDGVVFAELGELRDPALVPGAVAAALSLSPQNAWSPREAVIGYLRDRELLLILDTCEHVLDECARFTEAMLREAPGVRILATSREPTGLPGEAVYELGPLRVPAHDGGPASQDTGDAVELFAQRAAGAVHGFELTEANRPQVVAVCQQLDGIPLAIELAAVRLRALSLEELTQRLGGRMWLLAGGHRGIPRHKTLRGMIGWSYDLCNPAEQALWARLSVFAGPFGVEAARDVCGDRNLPGDVVVDALIGLVDKSVLIREEGPAPLYRMLDTIREYGAEQLAGTPAENTVRRRLLQRYLRLATDLDTDPLVSQVAKYRALHRERASLWAAVRHSLAIPGQDRAAAQLLGKLYWYAEISGSVQEAGHYLGMALERFGDPTPERCVLLLLHGFVRAIRGEHADGIAQCEEGLALAKALGEDRSYARGHLYYCQALLAAGRLADTEAAADAAASLMAETGDRTSDVVPIYHALRHVAAEDFSQCEAACAEGLRRLPTDRGERWASGSLLVLAGAAAYLRGDTEGASAACLKSLDLRRELHDPLGIAYALGLLSLTATGQGRHRRAAWLSGATAPLWEQVGGVFIGIPNGPALAGYIARQARKALGEDAYGELLRAGASRSLDEIIELALSDADDLIPATAPATAPSPLTPREEEIAELVTSGLVNREIADRLVISKRTVDAHVEHIFAKLGISTRLQLAMWAREHAASHPPPPGK
jgi:non-specific serine/threonine protein kinase